MELGLTLLDVANKLGMREATVQRYESGLIKNIKYETIVALAEVLDTTPVELLGWREKPSEKTGELSNVDIELLARFRKLSQSQRDMLLSLADSWLQK
jgi:transcriptional regulator with XRE-family HTH domain